MFFIYKSLSFSKKMKSLMDGSLENRANARIETLAVSSNPIDILEDYRRSGLFKDKIGKYRLLIQRLPLHNGTNIDLFIVRDINHVEETNSEWDFRPQEWLQNNPITLEDLHDIDQQFNNDLNRLNYQEELPKLPSTLIQWTQPNEFLSESSIYETIEWIDSMEKINRDHENAYFVSFQQALEKVIDGPISTANNKYTDYLKGKVILFEDGKISILFRRLKLEHRNKTNTKSPENGTEVFLLIKAFYDDEKGNSLPGKEELNPKKQKEIRKKSIIDLVESCGYHHTFQGRDALVKKARRAYPSYLVIEPETWKKVQFDESSNLALSVEEEDILDGTEYPVFIDGQAGSGKSTMLHYLFAQFCFRALNSSKDAPTPIFLTYSKLLVDQARVSVQAILQNHPTYIEEDIKNTAQITSFFSSFEDFLINKCLSEEEARPFRFKENKITFAKFKLFYTGLDMFEFNSVEGLEKKKFKTHKIQLKYSPELVWHIIRSYIKGFYRKDVFTPEDYRGLTGEDKKNKSVSNETFQEVYDKVWLPWYKEILMDRYSYWDDQDLVVKTLDSPFFDTLKKYSVVFCDEAQDFTRVEIELILRLSAFSNYNLKNTKNLPLAFAGDPYQTINPTGFSWANLRSVIHKKFIELKIPNLNLHVEHLTQNYRSVPGIIQLANHVQFWRHQYLHETDLLPQEPWFSDRKKSTAIGMYIKDMNFTAQMLEEVSSIYPDAEGINTVVLTPISWDGAIKKQGSQSSQSLLDSDWQDDIIYDYVNKDEVLRNIVTKDDQSKTIFNLLGVFQSKGLEFEKIVLYNFGEYLEEDIAKIKEEDVLNESDKIQFSHFFNQLYVAITRAQNYLFIIDTPNGYQKLWRHFEQKPEIDQEENELWSNKNIDVITKQDDLFLKNIVEQNPLKIAEEMQQKGIEQQNPTLLKSAMTFYRSSGMEEREYACQLEINKINQNWKDAGKTCKFLFELYLNEYKNERKADDYRKSAAHFFWKGCCWVELADICKDLEKEKIDARNQLLVARFMQEGRNEDVLDFLADNVLRDHADPWDDTWRKIEPKIIEKLKYKVAKRDPSIGEAEVQNIQSYAVKGFTNLYSPAAELYFQIGAYRKAINCWENSPLNKEDSYPDEYYTAKAKSTSSPAEKIHYLSQRKPSAFGWEEIIQIYEDNVISQQEIIVNNKNAEAIFEAYLSLGHYIKGLRVRIPIDQKITTFFSFYKLDQNKKPHTESDILKEALANIIHSNQPQVLLKFIKDFSQILSKKEEIQYVLNFIFKQTDWKRWLSATEPNLKSSLGDHHEYLVSIVESTIKSIQKENFRQLLLAVESLKNIHKNSVSAISNDFINAVAESSISRDKFLQEFSNRNDQQVIHEFVIKQYNQRKNIPGVNYKAWGSVFERLGIHRKENNEQSVYEDVINSPSSSPPDKEYAQYRWLIAQKRKILHSDNENVKTKLAKDFEVQLVRWRLKEGKFRQLWESEQLPALDRGIAFGNSVKISGLSKLNPKDYLYDKENQILTFQVFNLEFKIFPIKKRANIMDLSDGYTQFALFHEDQKKKNKSIQLNSYRVNYSLKEGSVFFQIEYYNSDKKEKHTKDFTCIILD
jgi:hypothetical protein